MNSGKIRGFTLIEIIVVLAILSTVIALTLFSFQKSKINNTIRLASRQLLSDMEYAKSIAEKNAQSSSLVFSNSPKSYAIMDESSRILKKVTLDSAITWSAYSYTVSTYESCSTVTFYSNSSASSNYTVSLNNDKCPKNFTLSIRKATGSAKLSETDKVITN
ncbi:MAG: Tfp pilus assembly protein FimT/FimU [Vulcanimicrobiota bacterium]